MFEKLTPLSKQLNQKTDNLNGIIASFNRKLSDLNIGLEVWLELPDPGDPSGPSAPIEISEPRLVTDHQDDRYWQVTRKVLGYCRVEDEWQLAIKTELLETSEEEEPTTTTTTQSKRPLLKCSREERLKAVVSLEDLLDDIKLAIEQTLKDINTAEKLVAEL